jgi:transcriptional regulator with XRE-family HTH domain
MRVTAPLKYAVTLRTLRRAAGVNLLEAEKRSGMRTGRWEELEEGLHEPRAGDFVRAMDALRVRDYRVFRPEDFERCVQ